MSLIENYYPMSTAVAIIDATIAFLDGEDHLQPPNSRGSEEGGDRKQYFVGGTHLGELFLT